MTQTDTRSYANIFCFIELFLYANICRDESNPTYGMQTLFNNALKNGDL